MLACNRPANTLREGTLRNFGSFFGDEAGAVTIDWVAVTSGVLLLGVVVVYSVFNNGVSSLVSNVNATLVAVETDIGGNSDDDVIDSGDGGNASEQACITTGKFIVCVGPK
jgi:hypothetical protein